MSGNQAKPFVVFKRFLFSFSDIKIAFKIITKVKGKINLHTKGTLKGISKRHLYSDKTLKKSIKIWKKPNFLSGIPDISCMH